MINLDRLYNEDIYKCLKCRRKFLIYNNSLDIDNITVGILEKIFNNQKGAIFTVIVSVDKIKDTIDLLKNNLSDINVVTLDEFKLKFNPLSIIVSDMESFFCYDNIYYMFKFKRMLAGIILYCYNYKFDLSIKNVERFSFYTSSMPFAFFLSNEEFIASHKDLTLSLLHILFNGKYHYKKYYRGKIESNKLEECTDEIIKRGRQYYPIVSNYELYVDVINPTEEQVGIKGENVFDFTRGIKTKRQLAYLIKVLNKYKESSGVVFIKDENHAREIFRYLKARRYNCNIALKSDKDYEVIHEKKELRKTRGSFLITNLSNLADVYFDYIIFYEYTKDIEFILSKEERKYFPNKINIRFLITRNTSEPRLLYNICEDSSACKLLFGDKISIIKDAIID